MTGGGNKKGSEACYFRKQAVHAASCFGKLLKKLSIHSANKGSILIEFAVCMPVLIILLYYINDLSKLKRYYDQTEFTAQQMVNILQNISQNREDKKITLKDLKYAGSLACLNIYPGTTVYSLTGSDNSHAFSHDPYIVLHYVKGLPEGNASAVWTRAFYSGSCITPSGWKISNISNNSKYSIIKGGTNVKPSTIYPTLKINEGEVKILVEVQLVNDAGRMNPNKYVGSDNQETRAKKAFGCQLIPPKTFFNSNTQGRYFTSVVIFTPATGLFDETPPQ